MRKSIIYAALLAAALVVPVHGEDVGKLLPVELVHVYREGEAFVIATDTETSGTGGTIEAALENLKETTAGIVFLDTADYLLLSEDAACYVHTMKNWLKPTVRVCSAEADMDLKEASVYLSIHKPQVSLKGSGDGAGLQKLLIENGRLKLEEK